MSICLHIVEFHVILYKYNSRFLAVKLNDRGILMKQKHKKISLTTRYIVIACALLLAVNAALGFAMIRQSGSSMKALIRRHMLSVSNTAASLVDGDVLEGITADDVGSEEHQEIASTLLMVKNVQHDSAIKFIYLVKREDDHYVFTVDPDPVNPADYGEEVVRTNAQDIAWAGNAEVDEEPLEDEWGCFYTAWSPILNSKGLVVGMVGMDFAADWYDNQVAEHTRTVLIVSVISLLMGALIVFLLTGQLRRRMRELNAEVSVISEDINQLSEVVSKRPGYEDLAEEEETALESDDTIWGLSGKIKALQNKLKKYLQFAHEQAYTDPMTGVGNKSAYLDRVKEINADINSGKSAFAVAVFDVNGLKNINDNYGHECGDAIIVDAAAAIGRIFGTERIYRIGGDEFIAVLDATTQEELDDAFCRLDEDVDRFNREEKQYSMTLAFAHGGTVYHPGEDADFKAVFKRADMAMYQNKGDYYKQFGDRRKNNE